MQRWHTWSGDEMTADEIDRASFASYLKREDEIFADLRREVSDRLSAADKTPINRFYRDSLVYPQRFTPDWNRSFILLPSGKPRGAVVLLHGLTDSPTACAIWRKIIDGRVLSRWRRAYPVTVPRLAR